MTAEREKETGAGWALFPIPSPRLARTLRWQWAFLFVVGVVFWGAYLLHKGDALPVGYKTDFLGIYIGPRMFVEGVGSQLYDLRAQAAFSSAAVEPYKRSIMPFVYPAYVAVILKPLGMLKFMSALKVWFLVNLVAVLWSSIRLAELFGCPGWQRVAVVLIFFAWPPLQLTLIQGQMGLMLTLAFTETLIALHAGREFRAGFWLALGLLKPQMVLLPLWWFLMRRSWRVLFAFTIVMLAVLGISIFAAGWWIPAYLRFLAEYNRRGAELALYPIAMQNWRGLSTWLLHTDHGPAVWCAILALSGASAVAVWFVAPQSSREPRVFSAREGAGFAVAILLGLLSSPHLYSHDWVAALPAGFVLWSFARDFFVQRDTGNASRLLLWLIGLSPLVFFVRQFVWPRPIVPVYGILLVGIALSVLFAGAADLPVRTEET